MTVEFQDDIVEENKTIECWACSNIMTLEERADNDGFCVHCDAEIEL